MRIEPDTIARLADLMQRHGIATLDYDLGGASLSLRMAPGAAPAVATATGTSSPAASSAAQTPVVDGSRTITSPHVGFFRLAHPATAPAPSLPRVIKAGEIVGYVEALGLVHAITAGTGGTLARARVAEGEPVGYGTVLFDLTD
ncbi:Biotin carboxyl carrier protein [Rhizobium sp. RU20A]|uniref:acetyl-CoA carboxylase biotin carboxyl carrier protein n=1 Tax=Rhizobium sp. RU20A TaxID=1907412 RepID=UPI0009563637|nr:hypothetical protein [Rhizobium sp. RU20A]SIQ68829.1 Biotin carboxyl carrier protein [Rhizobium sp. RU20A]